MVKKNKKVLTNVASSVYRHLRRMENECLVKSEWDTGGSGPAKRHYKLTADGEDLLHSWVITIKKNKEILENFLELYNKQMSAQESCIPCSTGETCCDPSDAESGNHLPERGFVPIEDIMRSDKRRGSKGVSGEILKMAANGKMGCFYLAVPRTVGKR